MLQSKASQFTISPEAEILWQEKLNNPLPGIPVARITKGEHPLKPVITVIESELTGKYNQTELHNNFNLWFKTKLAEVLEPLMQLEIPQGVDVKDDAVSKIAAKLYDGLGIVSREDLEAQISELTPETRADLRAKKIRLGPILAFIPALNKPAAVRLKALLWSLYHDKKLPAAIPADGIVSVKIEDVDGGQDYYRAIGYPLYGGRAVRIDMLDRVISCVYDHADGGKFQARHEMAEWLGCPIADLYQVLEAMGHTKVYDPAENVPAAVSVSAEAISDSVSAETAETPETPSPVEAPAKPELATFRLKKGKAFQKSNTGGGERPQKKVFDRNTDKKPQNDKKKDFKKKKDHGKRDKKPQEARIMSFEAKVNAEDSPFAILQQLKK